MGSAEALALKIVITPLLVGVAVLRGLLLGLFAFAGFFLTLAVLLEPAGIATAFVAALAVALVLQGLSLLVGRRLAIA